MSNIHITRLVTTDSLYEKTMPEITSRRPTFTDWDIEQITITLSGISRYHSVTWQFIDGNWGKELIVEGIGKEPITFSTIRAARAGLDMFEAGYNVGYGVARKDNYEERLDGL